MLCPLQTAQRSFVNHREVRKAAITTRVLSLVHEVLDKVRADQGALESIRSHHARKCFSLREKPRRIWVGGASDSPPVALWVSCIVQGIHITKRDMFYTDVKLFKKQVRGPREKILGTNRYRVEQCMNQHNTIVPYLIVLPFDVVCVLERI